jgi:hypothetical protein
MIFPGAKVSVEDSAGLLLWLTFAENGKGTLRLPQSVAIDDWSLDPAFLMDLRVKKSAALSWGLISAPGSNLVVEDTKLGPGAIPLWGTTRVADVDVPKLDAIGIGGIFQPGAPMQHIVEFIQQHVAAKVD